MNCISSNIKDKNLAIIQSTAIPGKAENACDYEAINSVENKSAISVIGLITEKHRVVKVKYY